MEKSYKTLMNGIENFIFDVDGVLTDGSLLITTKGDQLRRMYIGDGYAIKAALQKGYKVCIISGGKNEGVRERLRGLGVTDIYLGIDDKTEVLEEYMELYGLDPDATLYMGDDIPDLYVMQKVGLPVCPQNAVPEIKALSKYVSHRSGGDGCVRDVIEQVLKVRGHWLDENKE